MHSRVLSFDDQVLTLKPDALERVRQSRRDIADKAAKGFSDMKAYYEAEPPEAAADPIDPIEPPGPIDPIDPFGPGF